jgi:hypothetical protein
MDQDTIETVIPGRQNLACAWIVAATLLLLLLAFSAADRLLQDEPQARALPLPAAAAAHLDARGGVGPAAHADLFCGRGHGSAAGGC